MQGGARGGQKREPGSLEAAVGGPDWMLGPPQQQQALPTTDPRPQPENNNVLSINSVFSLAVGSFDLILRKISVRRQGIHESDCQDHGRESTIFFR